MAKANKQPGFGLVGVLILLVVAVLVAFGGYKVYQNQHQKTLATSATAIPQKIQSKSDLNQASQALDSQQINSSLDPTQLDKDIQSLY